MPNIGGYATAAYIAAAIIYVSYALSIRVRSRALCERLRAAARRASGKQ